MAKTKVGTAPAHEPAKVKVPQCATTWSVGLPDTHRAIRKGDSVWVGHRCNGRASHGGTLHICRCGAVCPPELPGVVDA